jgi:hypothetical protein
MNFSFRPARRQNVSLLIGLAGSSGSGKSFSAMRLASGMSKGKRFAVIDTEAGRASHYADQFEFDVGELHAPFRPDAYAEAIMAADAAGYPVIVVDSMSHEWAGDGGILDWQEEELDRMAGDDWKKREAVKMAAWINPKMAHKHMMQKLLQVRAHLILCFRAEAKIEMVKDPETRKLVIQPKASLTGLDGWIPVTEKSVPFELTVSFLLTADAPGVGKPIKLQEQHKALFPSGALIDEACGQRIASWAAGGVDWRSERLKAVADATTLDALKTAASEGARAFREAGDAPGRAAFEAAVKERGAAIRAAGSATDAFVAEMDAAERGGAAV